MSRFLSKLCRHRAELHTSSVGKMTSSFWWRVCYERLFQMTVQRCMREFADQFIRRGEASLEAVLNSATGDRDSEVRLPATRRAGEDC